MSKYHIDGSTLTAIADAIREKAQTTDGINPADMAEMIAGLGGEGLIIGTSRAVTGEFTPSETVQGGSVTITTGLSDVAEKLKLDTEKAHYGNFFFMWDASRREQVSSVSPNYSSSVGGSIIGCVFLNIHTGSYLRQYALTLYYWNSNINIISNSGHCTVTNVGDSGILDTINFAYSSSKYAAGHRYCWVAGFSEDV